MGNIGSHPVQLTAEENKRLRELAVYSALLISLSSRQRTYLGAGLTPKDLAPLALDPVRSNRSDVSSRIGRSDSKQHLRPVPAKMYEA